MSINKLAASLVLARLLGASSVLADEQPLTAASQTSDKAGTFIGVYLGSNAADLKYSFKRQLDNTGYAISASGVGAATSSSRLGIVSGRYISIDDRMGFRVYGSVDFGDDLYNIAGNADFLYSFLKFEKVELRGFIGAWVGPVIYQQKSFNPLGDSEAATHFIYGVDGGLNVGARVVLFDRHGIELFWRNGFREMETKIEESVELNAGAGTDTTTWKLKQSYQTGIRYTFTF